ncbi:SDR family NAD(P)-dependent oxidoreductase [Acuticoccus kandeliae]|uniref:SDR family NAD(P)-dependent oxidoreductase n=1 Tax=Acuticoccus kandeliae TaxID=2073160 RepID=UPI000D3E7382|nr:SDR family NAD(P)-dependent oxidoreductase [Acuticoccus kandeliae]
MADRLKDRIALVFGAGSVGEGWGNGKAAAAAYAREGAKVVCVDLNADAAEATRAIIEGEGGEAIALSADVTDAASIKAAVDKTVETYGRIDILHNNVGMNIAGSVVQATEEDWRKVMDVNLTSIFLTCKAVIPVMEAQGKGAIINISSMAAVLYTGYPYASYYASKAAVNHLTRSIAMDYATKGIRANTIMPGLMDTPHIYKQMAGYYEGDLDRMRDDRASKVPMRRQGSGWDIGWAAVFLASDEAGFITGVELPVDGGQHCMGKA